MAAPRDKPTEGETAPGADRPKGSDLALALRNKERWAIRQMRAALARDEPEALSMMLERLKVPEQWALDAFAERYRPMLVALCRRHVRDPHAAEDIATDLCMMVLGKTLERLNSADHLTAFLTLAARHRSLNYVQRQRPTDPLGPGGDPMTGVVRLSRHTPLPPLSVERVVELRRQLATLEVAREQVDPERWNELHAFRVDGIPVTVLAEQAGVSVAAMSKRIITTAELLKQEVTKIDGERSETKKVKR